MSLPLRYCAQCGQPFTSSHPTKRFCTIMCQVKRARQAKFARDREQQLTGGELQARQQAIIDAARAIPLGEGQTPTVVPISPRLKPMEAPGTGQDEASRILREAGIAPTLPSVEVEVSEEELFKEE